MDGQDSNGANRRTDLQASARGWHGAQLAVLGFIGLCGVLQSAGSEAGPRWLQIIAGLLVLLALVLSCAATALVAGVAWPIAGRESSAGADAWLERGRRRLRIGVVTTFVAVGVLALAATSSWWPRPTAGAGSVEVTTGSGVLCGSLGDGEAGSVALTVAGHPVVVSLSNVVRLRSIDTCD